MLVMHHQHVGVAARNRHADLAGGAFGKPLGELREAAAAVGGLEDTAELAAGIEPVGGALTLPEGHPNRVRIVRVHDRFDSPGPIVVRQAVGQLFPSGTAVRGLEEPALTRPPDIAQRGDVDDVRIGRVGQHRADGERLLETHVGERDAAVGRLVDAVTPGSAVPTAFLAGAHPDDVRIALEDGHVADRGGAVVIEDRGPRVAGVDRLEDAAGSGADDHVGEIVVEGVDRRDAALLVGVADVAPGQILDQGLLERLLHRCGRSGGERAAHGDGNDRRRAGNGDTQTEGAATNAASASEDTRTQRSHGRTPWFLRVCGQEDRF